MPRRPGHSNLVRIIGGRHRGRKLSFPDAAGLRPTSDRIRETLFNWLQPFIDGADCLDLFAGSGSVGFEAVSRGAGRVTMVEKNPKVAAQLKKNAALLEVEKIEIIVDDALRWLEKQDQEFDIVFLDPPFADKLLQQVIDRLINSGALKPGAHIYLEQDAKDTFPTLPASIEIIRKKNAGQVNYALAKYGGINSQ